MNFNRDSLHFVNVINEVWSNYQRFVFAHQFVCDKYNQFFETFHKMGNSQNYTKEKEVLSVSSLAVYELKKYFEKIEFFTSFQSIFS